MTFLSVFGHTNIDYIIYVDGFPEINTCVQAKEAHRRFGGVAANIAMVAARIGVPTSLVSYVGDEFPSDFYQAFVDAGVGLQHFEKVKGFTSPQCFIFTNKEMEQSYMLNQGPMANFEDFEPPKDAVAHSEILHMSTGRPGYYLKLVQMAAEMGASVSFDPAQGIHYDFTPENFKTIFAGTHRFFCNRAELGVAMNLMNVTEPEDLLEFVDLIVMTDGAKGSVLFTAEETFDIPIYPTKKVVDPTGAGDSYRAGFYYGLQREYSLRDCVLLGACTSSFIIEGQGPQSNIPTETQVLERFETLKSL